MDEMKKYLAVRKELETAILKQLQKIKEKVEALPEGSAKKSDDIQRLINVSDELDDVLYNWSEGPLGVRSFDDSYDEFDD